MLDETEQDALQLSVSTMTRRGQPTGEYPILIVNDLLCSESERFGNLAVVVRFGRFVLPRVLSCLFTEVFESEKRKIRSVSD